MALMKCPECNKQVSSKSETCPHCGYRLEKRNFFLWLIGILALIWLVRMCFIIGI